MSLDPFITLISMLKENWLYLLKENPLMLLNPVAIYNSPVYNPVFSTSVVCVFASLLTSILGTITGEYSWVDRIWSIIPFVYTWLFFLHPYLVLGETLPDLTESRLFIMAMLTSLWGIRLTYNFWRKGGYAPGGEDYRWKEVRTWFNPVTWQLFNFAFIGFYQNFLLWAITLPIYAAWLRRDVPFHSYDLIPTISFLIFLSIETIADEQQWVFQMAKKEKKAKGVALTGDYQDGFLQSGLFRFSRHPNFFSEFSQWWCFYLFSLTAFINPEEFSLIAVLGDVYKGFNNESNTDMIITLWSNVVNFTMIGVCLLTMLFNGSTDLTETLSVKKYPKYREYQKSTSRLIFWFPGKAKPKST